MEIRKLKDDALRVKHEAEVALHKTVEREEVQNEQDEAIAALYEEFLSLIPDDDAEAIEILSRDDVKEVCKDLISHSVTQKVNAAVEKVVPDIVAKVIAAMSEAEDGAQEGESSEGEEIPEETEKDAENDAQDVTEDNSEEVTDND